MRIFIRETSLLMELMDSTMCRRSHLMIPSFNLMEFQSTSTQNPCLVPTLRLPPTSASSIWNVDQMSFLSFNHNISNSSKLEPRLSHSVRRISQETLPLWTETHQLTSLKLSHSVRRTSQETLPSLIETHQSTSPKSSHSALKTSQETPSIPQKPRSNSVKTLSTK